MRVTVIEAIAATWGIVGWLATGWIGRRYPDDRVRNPEALPNLAEGATADTPLAGDR